MMWQLTRPSAAGKLTANILFVKWTICASQLTQQQHNQFIKSSKGFLEKCNWKQIVGWSQVTEGVILLLFLKVLASLSFDFLS